MNWSTELRAFRARTGLKQEALADRAQIEHHWCTLVDERLQALEAVCGEQLALELLELRRYAEATLAQKSRGLEPGLLARLNDDSRHPDRQTRLTRWRLLAAMVFTDGANAC